MSFGRYDAVTYLKYLDTLRVSESFRSVWIFAESSYKIFDYAKKRVYRFTRSDAVKLNGQSKSVTGKKRNLKKVYNNEDEGECYPVVCFVLVYVLMFVLCGLSNLLKRDNLRNRYLKSPYATFS